MDIDQAWRSAKLRAWGVGVLFGILGGVVSAGGGMFAGLCCLFQFANLIAPAATGLGAGLFGSAFAPWSEMGEGGAGMGAGLGFRAGVISAFLAGILGFCFAMIIPILVSLFQAISNSDDLEVAITSAVAHLAISGTTSLVFAGGGALLGVLFGIGTGAIMGAVRGNG